MIVRARARAINKLLEPTPITSRRIDLPFKDTSFLPPQRTTGRLTENLNHEKNGKNSDTGLVFLVNFPGFFLAQNLIFYIYMCLVIVDDRQ